MLSLQVPHFYKEELPADGLFLQVKDGLMCRVSTERAQQWWNSASCPHLEFLTTPSRALIGCEGKYTMFENDSYVLCSPPLLPVAPHLLSPRWDLHLQRQLVSKIHRTPSSHRSVHISHHSRLVSTYPLHPPGAQRLPRPAATILQHHQLLPRCGIILT